MAEPHSDSSLWTEIGKAIAYIVTVAGGLWGTIWSARQFVAAAPPQGSRSNDEEHEEQMERMREEIRKLTMQVQQNAANIAVYLANNDDVKRSVERIHTRIDEMATKIADLNGYIRGQNEKKKEDK